MAGNRLSLAVTEAYRERLLTLRDSAQALARNAWRTISMDDLEGTFERWRTLTATGVAGAQQEALRASAGYVGAFVASELDGPVQAPPPLSPGRYVGKTRDGRPVTEALESPLIGIRVELKRGLEPAMREGLNRALRLVEGSVMHAARASLNELMEADEHIEGWQRAVGGTCGACAGDIAVEVYTALPSLPLNIHPNCQCVTQPVIIGVPDRFPLLTGEQLLDRKSPAEQDAALGTAAAEAIRNGDITLADLVGASRQERGQDFLTQAPVKDGR